MQGSQRIGGFVLGGVFVAGMVVATLLVETLLAGSQRPAADRDREAAIDVLLAKDAISQQIFNYSRALDRMDTELALQMMHPGGNWNGSTREVWVKNGFDVNRGYSAHSHQMTNSTIKVTGDKAVSETYGWVPLRRPTKDGDKEMATDVFVMRYLDRWSKRNGKWALDERQMVGDMRITVHEPLTSPALARIGGQRDRTDPVYRFFP